MSITGDFLSFMQSEKLVHALNRAIRVEIAFPSGKRNNVLLPQRVVGTESICGGIEYTLLCLATSASLPLKEFIALPVEIQFVTDRGDVRRVCGIVDEARAGSSDGGMAAYELVIRDALALMSKRINTRIFRDKNELDIVKILFNEWRARHAVLVGAFELEISTALESRQPPKREFTQQHNESDARFITRLLKRRGIAWYIRAGRARTGSANAMNTTPAHTLVLFDKPQNLYQNAAGTVRFHRDDATEERDTITAWHAVRKLKTGTVTRHSWDYKMLASRNMMTVSTNGLADQGMAGNGFAVRLEDYVVDSPHIADNSEDLLRLGQLRMDSYDYDSKCFHGEGSVRDFCAGEYFRLSGHPEIDQHPAEERDFVVTELRIHAVNNLPSGLAERAERLFSHYRWHGVEARLATVAGTSAVRSHIEFTAVRRGINIVAYYDPRIDLPPMHMESAIVVGPENEAVHCDQMGRVKVRFPGTRPIDHEHACGSGASETPADSAWIRVASNWAGNGPGNLMQCGTLTLPRVGTEVLIVYLGGDPDKPIIVGQLYNDRAVPPAISDRGNLPGNRYLSGLRSREVQGSRANRLQLDDTPGQISAMLASDHGHSELNLGWLTQPRANGAGCARGEGAELRSDRNVAIRGAKGVLISAAAQEGATGGHLDREELVGIAQTLQGVAEQLSQLAVAHRASEADGGQLAELVDKLRYWHRGTNVDEGASVGGSGGEPVVAVSAPAGAFVGSQQNVVLGAQSTIDTLSVGDTRIGAGANLFLRAARGMSLFAYKLGIKLIAASGNIRIETQNGDVEIVSLGRIKFVASKGIELQAPEIKVIAQGVQSDYGGGKITQQSSGEHIIKSSAFKHTSGGNGSVQKMDLPSTAVMHDQQVLVTDLVSGEPYPHQNYRITLEDGKVFEGTTDAEGLTEKFETKLAFARYDIELLD